MTTGFAAEQTLTADTVPVNVDAVLFWMVHDPEKAALEVQSYYNTVSWAAQTALRDIIGRTSLGDLLRGRERIEEELQKLIDGRSNPWGVTVQSVEMRDIVIPASLQDAMSREAQATREKQARVILGQAEVEIAQSFEKAAAVLSEQPDRAASARHEHALRRAQGKGRAHAGAELGRRVDGHGRADGIGRAHASTAHRISSASGRRQEVVESGRNAMTQRSDIDISRIPVDGVGGFGLLAMAANHGLPRSAVACGRRAHAARGRRRRR